MYISLKKIMFSNYCMLLCSLAIGYSLWFMLSQQQIIQQTITIPTTVFNNNEIIHQTITNATVEGARFAIKAIQYQPPRINIYADERATSPYTIATNDILLPENISIIDYWPKTIILAH